MERDKNECARFVWVIWASSCFLLCKQCTKEYYFLCFLCQRIFTKIIATWNFKHFGAVRTAFRILKTSNSNWRNLKYSHFSMFVRSFLSAHGYESFFIHLFYDVFDAAYYTRKIPLFMFVLLLLLHTFFYLRFLFKFYIVYFCNFSFLLKVLNWTLFTEAKKNEILKI